MVLKVIRSVEEAYYRRMNKMRFKIGVNSLVAIRNITFKKNNFFQLGDQSIFHGNIIFENNDNSVVIGDRTFIGGNTKLICYKDLVIGSDVLISWGCTLIDHNSHSTNWEFRKDDVVNLLKGEKCWDNVISKNIIIKDKAWIGFNCIIMKGVTISEGAIIGSGSVVTRDVPPFCVFAGNPAKYVKDVPNVM